MTDIIVPKSINDKVREFKQECFEVGFEPTTSIMCSFISETLVGHIFPGFVTAIMSYRQRRMERNVSVALDELKEHLQRLEVLLKALSEDVREKIKTSVFPMVFDYAADEAQEEKIKLLVNGFESAVETHQTDKDLLLTYYDILKSLRMIEIKMLVGLPPHSIRPSGMQPKTYPEGYASYVNWLESFPVDPEHQPVIVTKLNNSGLIHVEDFIVPGSAIYKADQIYLSAFGHRFIEFFKVQHGT